MTGNLTDSSGRGFLMRKVSIRSFALAAACLVGAGVLLAGTASADEVGGAKKPPIQLADEVGGAKKPPYQNA
jgi:hypothetical protein